MKESQVKAVYKYRNKWIVIIEMLWGRNHPLIGTYHNGYVSVVNKRQKEKPDYHKAVGLFSADELTYSGEIVSPLDTEAWEKCEGVWFFGFDSAHLWNDRKPESKTFESVKERSERLADEMIAKGW